MLGRRSEFIPRFHIQLLHIKASWKITERSLMRSAKVHICYVHTTCFEVAYTQRNAFSAIPNEK